MKRKTLMTILLAAVLLFSSSCSVFTGELSGMLTPPALSTSRQALTKTLKSVLGDYELVYPQSGSYRTGIIPVDLNGDQVTEGVCFYKTAGGLGFLALENRQDSWHILGRGKSDAASISRVAFGDLDGDGLSEIIVGWQYLSDSDSSYEVYAMEKGEAISKFTGLFSQMTLLEGAGKSYLVVLNRNSATKAVTAALVGESEGEIALINTVTMNSRVTSYLSILPGKTSAGDPAVYIDEQLEEGLYGTEVLAINEQGRLTNELLTQLNTPIWRSTGVTCQDVNGDEIPEVPAQMALPAYYRNGLPENLYLVQWSQFDGRTLYAMSYSFVDANEKFTVAWGNDWLGRVTVERSLDADRSFEFKNMETGELFFTIRVCGNGEYSPELGNEGWRRLYTDSDHIYLVLCQPENSLGIDYLEVFGLFDVIT